MIILGSLESAYSGLLLVSNELFSLGVTAETLRAIIQNRRFRSKGAGWPKISGRRGRSLPTILLLRKHRLNVLSYCIKIWTYCSSVLSQTMRLSDRQCRQTDGRMDRILIARPHLHSMQRGKNWSCSCWKCDCEFSSLLNYNIQLWLLFLDCWKIEVMTILGNFRSLIELLIFGAACLCCSWCWLCWFI